MVITQPFRSGAEGVALRIDDELEEFEDKR